MSTFSGITHHHLSELTRGKRPTGPNWIFWDNFWLCPDFRGQPRLSKETSYSAAIIWSRSSPNSTAPGPRLQTGRSSTSTSRTSKAEQIRRVSSSRAMLHVPSLVRQVPGTVQAGQSVREIHPGRLQERQRRILQAQEQPPAGGVGALDGVALLLASACPWGFTLMGGVAVKTPSYTQLVTSHLDTSPTPPPLLLPPVSTMSPQISAVICLVVFFASFSLFLFPRRFTSTPYSFSCLFSGRESLYLGCPP